MALVIFTSAWVCHPRRRTCKKKYWLSFKVIQCIQALSELNLSILRTLSLKFMSRFYCSDHSQSNCSVQDPVKICSESLCLLGDFNNCYDNNS